MNSDDSKYSNINPTLTVNYHKTCFSYMGLNMSTGRLSYLLNHVTYLLSQEAGASDRFLLLPTAEAHLLSTCGTVVNGIELGEKMMNSRQRLASISASISESRLSRGFRENHIGQWYHCCSFQQGPGLYLFASAQLPADILFSPGWECGLPWESLSFSVLLSHSDEFHQVYSDQKCIGMKPVQPTPSVLWW